MLSKSDREFFRRTIDEIVRAELRKALTVRMLMEQKRDPKTGQPLAVPVTKEMDVFIPEFWATYLPFYEAAIRGMQETTDHAKNNSAKSLDATKAIPGVMIPLEESIVKFVEVMEKVKQIAAENPEKFAMGCDHSRGKLIDLHPESDRSRQG